MLGSHTGYMSEAVIGYLFLVTLLNTIFFFVNEDLEVFFFFIFGLLRKKMKIENS